MTDSTPTTTPAHDGTRTRSGGTYGDFVPSDDKRNGERSAPGVEPPEAQTPPTPVDPYPPR